MTAEDAIERAIAGAAVRVLRRRAAILLERASTGTTRVETKLGDKVDVSVVVSPEARLAQRFAVDWSRIADEIAADQPEVGGDISTHGSAALPQSHDGGKK